MKLNWTYDNGKFYWIGPKGLQPPICDYFMSKNNFDKNKEPIRYLFVHFSKKLL